MSVTATQRLKKDLARLIKDPVEYVVAAPLPSNILEWHYVVHGAPNTPFEGGIYHGKLIFPPQFPFKPPSIYMLTPNGRFQTNTRLCLSISDFHPDTWNPAWTVSSILTGLLSFMNDEQPGLGTVKTTDSQKRSFAVKSRHYNLKEKLFCQQFPELAEEIRQDLEREENSPSGSTKPQLSNDQDQSSPNTPELGNVGNILIVFGVIAVGLVIRYAILQTHSEQ